MGTHTIGRQPMQVGRPDAMARLPLRDELYLLGHDMDTGSPTIHPRALGVGLAASVLIDLILTGRVDLSNGSLVVAPFDRPSREPITDAAYASIRGTSNRTAARWLRGFADTGLYERVRSNLVTVGLLRHNPRRLRADLYPPVDTVWTIRVGSHLRSVLMHGMEKPDTQSAALCGLLAALRLHASLHVDAPAASVERGLRVIVSRHHPQVRQVVATVEDVVGDLATAAYA